MRSFSSTATVASCRPGRRRLGRTPGAGARRSGAEFAILICKTEGIAQVEQVAAHIVEARGAPFGFEDKQLSIAASIRMGFAAQELEAAQSLVRRADRK